MKNYYQVSLKDFVKQFDLTEKVIKIATEQFGISDKLKRDRYNIIMNGANSRSKMERVDYLFIFDYVNKIILMLKKDIMSNSFYVEIQYGKRNKYFNLIYKLNKEVGRKGVIVAFVSNIPTMLKFYIYIQCEEEKYSSVVNILESSRLKIDKSKGVEEFSKGMMKRMWNCSSFCKNDTKEYINESIERMFYFPVEE